MAIHILIVDPDADAGAATCAVVRHLVPTASVVCESTPERAWITAQLTPPDLLLIDLGTYASTGILLIQLCKEIWPAMRIIVLASARLAPLRKQECLANVYLEKPASPAQLLEALQDQLHGLHAVTPELEDALG